MEIILISRIDTIRRYNEKLLLFVPYNFFIIRYFIERNFFDYI